jgi:hypothetical protein
MVGAFQGAVIEVGKLILQRDGTHETQGKFSDEGR